MAQFTPEQIEQFLEEFFNVVGRRQYIGARYVTIFGRKGESTMEWDNDAPYEPLTVVMHEGGSYVSRQYVPTGIAIDNTDYWLPTFQFNAQIEQYRRDVAALAEEVGEFQDSLDDISEEMTDNDNTLLSLIENIDGSGASFEIGKNSKCVYTLFTLPRDAFDIDIDLLSGSTDSDASVYDYAVANRDAYLVMNCSASDSIIWDHQMVNGTDWELGASNGCFGLKDNGDIMTISGTGNRWSDMLVCDKAFACWQVLVDDGIAQPIASHSSFQTMEPRQTLAWDDDNWYVYTVYGRFSRMFGLTMEECRGECLERGWTNAIAFDGGGSNNVFACNPARTMSPIIEGNMTYRENMVGVVFRKREV